MSVALVTVCQQCYGPVVVVEQLELVPEEDMGWHHAVEVCLAPGCDWWRERDVAEVAPGYTEACTG